MEFVWKDEPEIGYYECELLDKGEKLLDVAFWDYTCKYSQQADRANGCKRPYSFEMHFCSGFSRRHGFDFDEQFKEHYDKSGRTIGGYQGKCRHTVDDVKKYCEEFLASFYIIDYAEECRKLEQRKNVSDRLLADGYTGQPEKYEHTVLKPYKKKSRDAER